MSHFESNLHCILFSRLPLWAAAGVGLLPQHGHYAQRCQASQCDDRSWEQKVRLDQSFSKKQSDCILGCGWLTGVWQSSTTLVKSTMSESLRATSRWPHLLSHWQLKAFLRVQSCWLTTRCMITAWTCGALAVCWPPWFSGANTAFVETIGLSHGLTMFPK